MSAPFPFPHPGMPMMMPPPGFPMPFPLPMMQPPPPFDPSRKQPVSAIVEEVISPPDDCEPNETLYVNNLNSRITEKELRPFMHKLFARFGKCDVIAMSSLRRRGQVWVVYSSVDESKAAMEALQGHLAFGKKMRISFSKNVSDKTREAKHLPAREKRTTPLTAASAPLSKKQRTDETFFNTAVAAPKTSQASYNPPNRLLFVGNLSDATTIEQLNKLFAPFEGFVETRLIPSRGVGFVEFVDEYKSQPALMKLQGHELEKGRFLMISNAKR